MTTLAESVQQAREELAAIDAKIAVFEKFAGGKVRPFPSARVHHDPI